MNDADEGADVIRARNRPDVIFQKAETDELLRQGLAPLGFRGHSEDEEARRHMWT